MDELLTDFIIAAKKSGYAGKGGGKRTTYNDGSVAYSLENHTYRYTDHYYGFNPFSGSEHIYDGQDNLIWKMNYFGSIVPNYPQPSDVYDFLKEAMLLITPDYLYRGPRELMKGDLIYENRQSQEDLSFHGVEEIKTGATVIYTLHYHGGLMLVSDD